METRANFVLLGAATLIGALFLMLFSAWLIGSDWRSGYKVYEVVFDGPIRGISDGSEVRFNGIKVGSVRGLSLDESDPTKVIARVQISATTPVKADTIARLEAIGLTGVNLIQLYAGSSDAPLAQAEDGRSLPRIYSRPGALEGLLTEENAGRILETLTNLQTITRKLAQDDSIVTESAVAARRIAAAAESITRLADSTTSSLSGLTTSADAVLRETRDAIASANVVITQLQGAAGTAENETLPEMTEAARDLRRLSRAIERLAGEVEENPSAFLSAPPRPTIQVPQ